MMLHYHPNNKLAKHKELFFQEIDVGADPEAVIYVDLKSPWCVASAGYYAGFYNDKTQEVQIFQLKGISKSLVGDKTAKNPFEPSCVRASVEMVFVETLEVDRIEPEAYRKLVRRKPE